MFNKLHHYGIRGAMKNWVNNRIHYTAVNDAHSTHATVVTRVPQGSTLGPLIFLIYISDIINSSQVLKFPLFANDTNLTYSRCDIDSLTRTVNAELCKVSTWLFRNKLPFIVEKTQFLIFAANKKLNRHQSKITGNYIRRCYTLKYLGIHKDDKSNWKVHIHHILSKLSTSFCILLKIRHLLTSPTMLVLHDMLCCPHRQCCYVSWGMANKTAIKSLVILQKRIVRIINKANYFEHTSPLLKKCNILNIHDMYKLECLKFITDKHPVAYS